MNYRRGFQRLLEILTVVWIAGVWFFAPSSRLRFWEVDQITKVRELMVDPGFQQLETQAQAQKDALAEIGPGFAQISDEAYLPWKERMKSSPPHAHIRTKQFLWLASIIVLPPSVLFVIAFHVVPWIYRGFN